MQLTENEAIELAQKFSTSSKLKQYVYWRIYGCTYFVSSVEVGGNNLLRATFEDGKRIY